MVERIGLIYKIDIHTCRRLPAASGPLVFRLKVPISRAESNFRYTQVARPCILCCTRSSRADNFDIFGSPPRAGAWVRRCLMARRRGSRHSRRSCDSLPSRARADP
jgi:hypothetical protein